MSASFRLVDPFLKWPKILAVENLPDEMQILTRQIAAGKSQKEALRFAYEMLSKKYRGYRLMTFFRLDRLFLSDLATLWKNEGFLQCHHMNYLLRTLLVVSGQFSADDIESCWTRIWFVSPHQYLVVTFNDGTKVEVDLWARVYGIPFGAHAHGFHGGSIFAKIEQ